MVETLPAIIKNDLIFISAQPDTVYFHWQVEIYLYQFSKHGIKDNCYALFGYSGSKPSSYGVALAEKYKGRVLFYKDERTPAQRVYVPSVRPHILKQFFQEKPHLAKNVFYHDSDIFLVKLPKFEIMFGDDIGYLSDTISYIGYNYIVSCGNRYNAKHPSVSETDLVEKMCSCLDIPVDLIKSNEANSGGAQYLLKDVGYTFWCDVETSCNKLYDMLKTYEKTYPIDHHVQSWTTDMWSVLWNYWKSGKKTKLHSELDFSWATYSSADYYKKNIFHLAGVTDANKNKRFYKAAYINSNVLLDYSKNSKMFDFIGENEATYEYVKVIKEYVNSNSLNKEPEITCTRFLLKSSDGWSDIYKEDLTTNYHGKPLWRSLNTKYIIFYNSNSWILTASQYESDISPTCGGFASNNSRNPYEGSWNMPCEIEIL